MSLGPQFDDIVRQMGMPQRPFHVMTSAHASGDHFLGDHETTVSAVSHDDALAKGLAAAHPFLSRSALDAETHGDLQDSVVHVTTLDLDKDDDHPDFQKDRSFPLARAHALSVPLGKQ